MLLVNGVYLDPLDKENQHTKLYLKVLAEIEKKYKRYPIQLKYPERFKIFNELSPSRPIWPGGYYIWFKDRLPTSSGSDEWQYYEATHREVIQGNASGSTAYTPPGIIFNKNGLRIEAGKKDLAFFMLYVCSRCENSLNPDVVKNGQDKYFLVDDPKKESSDRMEKVRWETEARMLILRDAGERELREAAKAYDISNAMRVDINDPSAKDFQYDKNGYLTQDYDTGIPYLMSTEEVRDALLSVAGRLATGDPNIWEKICDRLQTKNIKSSNKDIFDKLIENNIIKLTDSIPNKTGANAGKIQKQWEWTEEYKFDESGKEKRVLHKCGYDNKTPDECMATFLDRMDSQTMFKVTMESVLKKAELI